MDSLVIEGPNRLRGKVKISGSKNLSLPLLFSSLLWDDPLVFENVPRLWDVETTLKLLESMGATYEWNKETGTVALMPKIRERVAPYEWVKRMRAGILALGPLLARYGEAKVSLPGGCSIGARPVNFHLDGFRQMGAVVEVEDGYIKAKVLSRLKGADISFPQVSVTATENLMIAATTASGRTRLINAACEPEVTGLGRFLKECGARIEGLGTPLIEIDGVPSLRVPSFPIVVAPDRIEGGTWIAISVATKSELTVEEMPVHDLGAVMDVYREMGVEFQHKSSAPREVTIHPPENLRPVQVKTEPFPGFPTDMQAQVMVNLLAAKGESHIEETIFENRFMHVAELQRLGARIEVEGSHARIDGGFPLKGAPLMATDLRASASLVVAALSATGRSTISRIYHLDRGYQRLDEKLRRVGANITRVQESL